MIKYFVNGFLDTMLYYEMEIKIRKMLCDRRFRFKQEIVSYCRLERL